MPTDNAGNTLTTANVINPALGMQTFSDAIGSGDLQDYYRFRLSAYSRFHLTLAGLTHDANVQLLHSDGYALSSSNNSGSFAESINRNLAPGTYYILVTPGEGSSTHYSLRTFAPAEVSTDLVWRHQGSGATGLWLMNGSTVTGYGSLLNSPNPDPNWMIATTGDFNGDGKADLLWRRNTGAMGLWYLNGSSVASYGSLVNAANPDPNWAIAATGDFDGNGKIDLLWRHRSTGAMGLWYLNGNSVSGYGSLVNGSNADTNWAIAAAADFNGDGEDDLLWRNRNSGAMGLWYLNRQTVIGYGSLANAANPDVNWTIALLTDANGDRRPDLLWRHQTLGTNGWWFLNGTTVTGYGSLGSADPNWRALPLTRYNFEPASVDMVGNALATAWEINHNASGSATYHEALTTTDNNDYYKFTLAVAHTLSLSLSDLFANANLQLLDSNGNVLQTSANSGFASENMTRNINPGTYYIRVYGSAINTSYRLTSQVTLPGSVTISNRSFSGQEGDAGTFEIRLNQVPLSNVTVTLTGGNFVSLDADNTLANGMQDSITFTPANWNQPKTVWFIAEKDGSSANRTSGNLIHYSLSGALSGSGTYNLGTVTNTYAPDLSRFNIELDFRIDHLGFWTPQRREFAQQAANDWAVRIAEEFGGYSEPLNIGLGSVGGLQYWQSNRYIDDIVIFVGSYSENDGSAGRGGVLATASEGNRDLIRAGFVGLYTNLFDFDIYSTVSHEIGHALGLVGRTINGVSLIDASSPQTAVFRGEYARVANGGAYVPLQSQDGPNPVTGEYNYSHPANRVHSIMSYGRYPLSTPTNIDFAMLADSGYRITGINA